PGAWHLTFHEKKTGAVQRAETVFSGIDARHDVAGNGGLHEAINRPAEYFRGVQIHAAEGHPHHRHDGDKQVDESELEPPDRRWATELVLKPVPEPGEGETQDEGVRVKHDGANAAGPEYVGVKVGRVLRQKIDRGK